MTLDTWVRQELAAGGEVGFRREGDASWFTVRRSDDGLWFTVRRKDGGLSYLKLEPRGAERLQIVRPS